jgi:murein DD-endopeptidase MepM/ murein hydrolase activator NlpD
MLSKLSRFKELFTQKIRNRYRLIIRNDQNLEERVSIVLTPLNVILLISGAMVIFTTIIILLFPMTPLSSLLPSDRNVSGEKMNELQHRIDSLERKVHLQEAKDSNLMRILRGNEVEVNRPTSMHANEVKYTYASFVPVDQGEGGAEKKEDTQSILPQSSRSIKAHYVFFSPLKGIISDTFNVRTGHTAIDVVSYSNAAVKATLDGAVVLSSWTPETGHVMVIQHRDNLISVYKHNSTLLKKQGTVVRAGEVIALVGNSGELTTGPHLHFELWQNGRAVNPADYMTF